jgi:hypothetical protein
MGIGECAGADVGTDAAQVEHSLLAGALFDLIAQNQDVDASKNGAVWHGGTPSETGAGQGTAEYSPARPDKEQHLDRGNLDRQRLEPPPSPPARGAPLMARSIY